MIVIKDTGLILEGGGMRGIYTAGVLEYFMENNLYFPYNIGVSAGACIAASYLSRQKGRNKRVNVDFADHPKYISYKNLLTKKQLFGMDFIFDEIPNKHVPFDFDTFNKVGEKFLVGTTDCITGEPVYYDNKQYPDDLLLILRASSSLPFMAPMIPFDNKMLMDGGLSDPIPIKKSEADGNCKNVIVLTRNSDYRKNKSKMNWLLKKTYRGHPKLVQTMMDRYRIYNDTLDYIEEQETKNNIIVIRPSEKLEVGRVERNRAKLLHLYEVGYNDAKLIYPKLTDFLQNNE